MILYYGSDKGTKIDECPVCFKEKYENEPVCGECRRKAERQKIGFERELKQYKERNFIRPYAPMMISNEDKFHCFFKKTSEDDRNGSMKTDDTRYGVNTVLGIPMIVTYSSWLTGCNGQCGGASERVISFPELTALAKRRSEDDYAKIRGMDETNWVDYVLADKEKQNGKN